MTDSIEFISALHWALQTILKPVPPVPLPLPMVQHRTAEKYDTDYDQTALKLNIYFVLIFLTVRILQLLSTKKHVWKETRDAQL